MTINQVDNDLIIDFFCANPNARIRRTHDEILRFSEHDIENYHDFIQWIFPTQEKSNFNRQAPVIDKNFRKIFADNYIVRQNFCKSCNLFLNFLGFNCLRDNKDLHRLDSAIMYFDRPAHNLLRITRVLNSLNQVGNIECSKRLFSAIKNSYVSNYKKIPATSFAFWEATQSF